MDGRPVGSLPLRRTWPRSPDRRRTGARRGRQIPRPARPDHRQHGRVSFDLRALRADLSLRDAARRPVPDAGPPLPREEIRRAPSRARVYTYLYTSLVAAYYKKNKKYI